MSCAHIAFDVMTYAPTSHYILRYIVTKTEKMCSIFNLIYMIQNYRCFFLSVDPNIQLTKQIVKSFLDPFNDFDGFTTIEENIIFLG